LLLGLIASPSFAAEVKLARHPDYHDGKIVFSYLGDLWICKDDGSSPHRLTVHKSRDIHPRFSPDGKWVAFSSDRHGNYDVFIIPAEGGKAKQLTYHTANDLVVGWSPDSKKIIFQSSRGLMYPGIPNLYEVPASGGLEQPILTDWGYWGSYSPDSRKFAFNRHPMVWWRQHYRGSYAADLWVLDVGKNKHKRLLDNDIPDDMKANNFWPMYGQGGDIYFVSDRAIKAKSGTPDAMKSVNNIWKVNDSGDAQATQVTFHKDGFLCWPSISADGKTIVYEQGFGLWKLDVATGKATEVKVFINSDDRDNMVDMVTFTNQCDSYHLSPSAKRAVISIHGELFTIPTDKGEVRRLTSTPNMRETQPAWSADGKWIAFVADKGHTEQLFLCDEMGGKLKMLTTGDHQLGQLRWSPDGAALLYTSTDNKLHMYSLATDKSTPVVSSPTNSGGFGSDFSIVNPQWSPDGKWISYTKFDQSLLPHVWVVRADGGEEKRITRPDNFSDMGAQWTADGKYLVYLSGVDVANGQGQTTRSTSKLYIVSLMPQDREAGDKGIDSEDDAGKQASKGKGPKGTDDPKTPGKVEVMIDFHKIGNRARQLTEVADDIKTFAVTPDGKKVIFVTGGIEAGKSVQSIWSIGVEGDKPARITQSGADPKDPKQGRFGGGFTSLQFNKAGTMLFYRQGKSIYTVGLAGAPAVPAKMLSFTCKVDVDRRAENQQVFNESWRVMKHRFYDASMHGVDWDKMREKYQPLVEHVADQEELHNIVNQMLGELNASHTGISGGLGGPAGVQKDTATRHPGFELAADKSGYFKVTHIYKHGPCDKDFIQLHVGDFLLAIDNHPLKAGDNYWKNYTHAPGHKLEFTVNSKPSPDGAWKFKIVPISLAQLSSLQYEKWVDERNALVERLTEGQIGYLHIKQMSEPELRKFERDLALMQGKKALIIDQRFNPGGNIDQQLLEILQQKQYQLTKGRNSTSVTRPLRGFFGPMVVLANERSTSDAEVFPDGFKTLKLGKVVGVTTYGAVIGTGSHQLMDGSVIRTPGMGLWSVSGTNLENNGVVPDVYIDNTPEDFFAGRDAQLQKAIEVLREQLSKTK
jgi:tricorn protease